MSQSYTIPAQAIEHTYEVKKSQFIARVCHVLNREQAMTALEQAKQDYPDARHHCWAYLLGNPYSPKSAAFSDDGEPSGTAGKPILNVLNHKGVGDILVIVTRYFGGIKLGAGGLVRAYSTATQQAMEQLPVITRVATMSVCFQCDYALEPELRRFLEQHQAAITDSQYAEQLRLCCDYPHAQQAELENFVAGRHGLTILCVTKP